MLKTALSDEPRQGFIEDIQRHIFAVSAHVAAIGADEATRAKYPCPAGFDKLLETRIDALSEDGAFAFTLPGGNEASARADVARTVARRAERSMAGLTGLSADALAFVNRLSDYLYALARKV